MTIGSSTLLRKVYRADEADPSNLLGSTVAAVTASQDATGFKLASAGAGTGHYHLGDKLFYNVDRLVRAEFLFKASNMTTSAQSIELGLITAYNADLSLTASRVILKTVAAAVNGKYLFEAFSDDGTTVVNNESTGFYLTPGKLYRASFGFKSGSQTVSFPGNSKPGKSSVQIAISDDAASTSHSFSRKTPLMQRTAHLDLCDYSGGLQPVIGFVSTGASPTLEVKEICIDYLQET